MPRPRCDFPVLPIIHPTAFEELDTCVIKHQAELRALLCRWMRAERGPYELASDVQKTGESRRPSKDSGAPSGDSRALSAFSPASGPFVLSQNFDGDLSRQVSKDGCTECTKEEAKGEINDAAKEAGEFAAAEFGSEGEHGHEHSAHAARASTTHDMLGNMIITDGMKYEDNMCARLVRTNRFDQVCAVVIAASSVLVGVEVELKTASNETLFRFLQNTFMVLFTLELLLRLRARGRMFFNGKDRWWSFFDIICVSSSYFELVYSSTGQSEDGSLFLMARTLRILRIARIIRVVRFLRQLRMMVYTMLGALKILFWMVLLLFMTVYMFGVCFYEAVKSFANRPRPDAGMDPSEVLLHKYYGSLPETMLTLFQSITGGVSWEDPFRALQAIPNNELYCGMFLLYICLVVFTILNVITGICCEHAMASAEKDKEDIIRQQLSDREGMSKQFLQVFSALDRDGSGEISGEEFKEHLNDEEFQAYLAHLNISIYSAADMFSLLDQDNSGSVSIEEFVHGCMRLQGMAKTVDIMKVSKDINLLESQMKVALAKLKGFDLIPRSKVKKMKQEFR